LRSRRLSLPWYSPFQPFSVPRDVLGHEGRDEEVRVIVPFLHPDGRRDIGLAAGLVQQMRLQLRVEEIVGGALVDQQLGQPRALLDQRAGVVLPPGAHVFPEIAAERLLAPWAVDRADDRRERAGRA